MPLVFGDEQVVPYVKFNAKEKVWSVNDTNGGITDITPPKLLIDLEHLQTGWFRFREAQAPDIVLDSPGTEAPEPDGENHKRGFHVTVFSRDHGVREMSSNSLMLKTAFKRLYNEWEGKKAGFPGKVPLVEVTDHTTVQGCYGTNYRPEFAIVGWHNRPDELQAVADKLTDEAATTPATPTASAETPIDLDDDIPW